MDEYEGMRKFGREDDKIAGKMREMRASSEVEKMKCGPDGRQSASRERGMTGIERLREFVAGISPVTTVCRVTAYDRKHMESIGVHLRDFLTDIADQIEREQEEHVSRMRVLSVVTEMERHVSGVEGAEDSPVARWARELREALVGNGRDPAADVSVSAYDLLPQEDREAISWVREHGGMDYVKSEWRSRVPYDRYERRRQRLLGHIAECETALGRRREIISKLAHHVNALANENVELRRRAMPEGMMGPGERVKRLAVFAADDEPLEVGQTVWDKDAEADTPLTVVEVSSDLVRCEYTWKDGKTYRPCYPPDQLTHQRPDSWERIEEDAKKETCAYFGVDGGGYGCSECPVKQWKESCDEVKSSDLVRRCRALAERDRGE